MNEIRTAPAAIVATAYFGSLLPMIPLMAKPAAGNSGIAQMRSRKFMPASPFHEVDFVDVHGFLVLEHRDDDPQSHRGFRRRYGDDKYRKDLAGDLLQSSGKGNQVDVDGVHNQLDRHQ